MRPLASKPLRVSANAASGAGEWVGFHCPGTVLLGDWARELRALPREAEIAVVDDLWLARRSGSALAGWDLHRCQFPFRNRSIVSRADLRGSVFLRSTDVWEADSWSAHLRARLVQAVDNPAGVARLTHTVRLVYSPQTVYRLAPEASTAVSDSKAESIRIVVCYRDRWDLTGALLADLLQQNFTAGRVELTLVNNQSQPQVVKEVVKQLTAAVQALPPSGTTWELIFLDYDLPYNHSAQCNLAVQETNAQVLLFLNNDARLPDRGALQRLADMALLPGVASVGPRVVGAGNRLVSAGMQIYRRDDHPGGVGLCESPSAYFSKTVRDTSGNSFGCAAVSAAVFRQMGGLDAEAFPTQYNDADFALRASKAGYQHRLVGEVQVFHEPGQTASDDRALQVRQSYAKLLERHRPLDAFLDRDPVVHRIRDSAELTGIPKTAFGLVDAASTLCRRLESWKGAAR